MSGKWFVQRGEDIEGPMDSDDVRAKMASGRFGDAALIWGRGMDGWRTLAWWNNELPNMSEATVVEVPLEMWHYAVHGKSHGPYSKPALVDELKHMSSLGEVMVWTKGMKEWAPLFEFHELLTAIGVNKRQFPRAEITGQVMLKSPEANVSGQLVSISEGGLGIQFSGDGLTAGQIVSVEIQSPAFRDQIHAKAEVRYVSGGVCGLKFTQLNVESKGIIIQYVRQNQTRFVLKAA